MNRPTESVIAALEVVAGQCSPVAALIDVHDDYRIVWANRQLKEFLKTAAVAPEGMRWGGRCPFAFGISAIKVMDEVVASGKPAHVEEQPFGARVSTRFGETTYWNWKIVPAPSDSCPGCIVAMAENVTDHVARRAVEHSRVQHFDGAILDLPVGVAMISPDDFRIMDANDIWLSYLPPDCQTRDSIGKTMPDCMPHFESSGLAPLLRRVVGAREVFTARELELKDPVRGSIWWGITLRIIEDRGSGDAILMTVWEVTEQVNARSASESARRRAQALLEVQAAISSSLALDKVLRLITDSARRLMDSSASAVFILTEDRQEFVSVGSSGLELSEACASGLAYGSSLAERALKEGRPVTLTAAQVTELKCLPTLSGGQPIAAIAAAPIEAEGLPIGVIEAYTVEHRRFSNDELETLATLAAGAASAIINARLFEQVGQARDELQATNRAIDNDRKLLMAVLESLPEAVAVVDSHYRVIQTNEAARKLYLTSEGEEISLPEMVGRTHPKTIDGREMSASEHPLALAVSGQHFRDFEYTIENDGEIYYRSVSGAAVRDPDGAVIFGVAIGRDITEQKRTRADLESALQREKRIAQTLQHALISELPPALDGFRMAGIYDAGLREAEIGGDFFDIFTPVEGKLAIVIGDVAGKGLSAAIQIAAAKYGIRSYAYEDPSPEHVVAKLNDIMYLDPPIGGFVTLFYGLIDVPTQTMVFCNAGHEPPLLRRTDGKVEALLSGGIVLGVAPSQVYEQRSVELRASDRLLLYTDGITEARKENGEMLGDDRLRQFWSECAADDAGTALDNVYRWAKDFSEGHFHDDVAVVVITRE